MSSSHKGEATRRHFRRPERKWVTGPARGIYPVADPMAECVYCHETGADWYGRNGDAVHLACWQRVLGDVGKSFNDYEEERNDD